MAYPQFSKDGLTTLVFSQGNLYPVVEQLQFNQVKDRAEGGPIRVATLSAPTTFLPLHFDGLSLTDYQNLKAWLLNPQVNGSAFPFTFTNVNGVEYEVRWWEDNGLFQMPEVSTGLYTVDIRLIVDTFA